MSNLRLVVFDMDGTLIDSQDVIIESMGRAFARLGYRTPTDTQIRSSIGLSLDKVVANIAPELSSTEVAAGVEAYRQSFIELRAENGAEASAPLYPGAFDALVRLHAQDEVLMGVATGKARRGLDHAYASHGIGHFFVTHQTADRHPSKPHPSMLYQALSDTGCEVEQAVMVGDTEFDIAMGKAAGFATIGVSWGYHPLDRIKAAEPDLIIDSYTQLDAALENIWQARS